MTEPSLAQYSPHYSSNYTGAVANDLSRVACSVPGHVPFVDFKIEPCTTTRERLNAGGFGRTITVVQYRYRVKLRRKLCRQVCSKQMFFTKMPNEHYMVEAKLILGAASEDVPNAAEIKTIIKDIWDIRMSKLRTSMDALMKSGGGYGRLDHLTMMEINSAKPLLPSAMDYLLQIQKKAQQRVQQPSALNTSTFSQSGSSQNT
ncbi:unnamed protein product [Spodoptera littoralis]|uniref:GINS complex subunit 2 n=1 Tax=Spodoptera littoralis TaxID=7109 RepID=A0A9P0N5N5_SPOLI|nr:unnamed protein product [Spodoptera littoralis]CAH1645817.1 unnamed protein product [Spodoptera littoralis]